jgi:uncharacterized protein (DUF488 family)
MSKLFTIGYQGRTIVEFLEILHLNHTQALVDIRENPYSKKEGFTKKELRRHLSGNNIEYMHLVELGCPKWLREQTHQTGDYQFFFKHYGRYLESQTDTLENLRNLISEKPICLMCMEQNLKECHRLAVANKLADMMPGLEIIHL